MWLVLFSVWHNATCILHSGADIKNVFQADLTDIYSFLPKLLFSGLQHAGRGRIRSCYITLQHVGNPQHPLLPKGAVACYLWIWWQILWCRIASDKHYICLGSNLTIIQSTFVLFYWTDIHRGFREVKNCLSESQTNPLQPIDVAHVPTSTAKLYIYLPSDPITLSGLLVLFKDFGALFVQKNPNFLLLQDCGNAPARDWRWHIEPTHAAFLCVMFC